MRPLGREIILVSDETRRIVRAHLDDGYSMSEGGYGGWEDEERPGQVSATVFRGTQSQRLTLRLILGGWPVQPPWANCDRDMRTLDAFGRKPVGAPRGMRPPLLKIKGKVPAQQARWFVEDIQWGDVDVVRGVRVRAFATVVLREYVKVELVTIRSRARARTKLHEMRKGQTLADVARIRLGKKGNREVTEGVRQLLRLNGRHRGWKPRTGDKVKYPVGGGR
ncbi:hypothetical protein [Conexibacter woesei]|uniref:Uncharacterized protein n=1 Tax=Conexibacter woesei (strain DSM 14684 / CCUG 47730 / CIP 108061 / JCM 11494 / NBRC 100937 / ID131577) TaxID=469383 RepID=D3F1Z4_CONWI|nr:hypothetical protein [Conexibacter woesei]ADB50169.1 hypothetical protein Cwoe_1742 [Conexibacter woesei DSM 14684]